jgi:hypothetical protein
MTMATALHAARNITAKLSQLSGRRVPVYASLSSLITPNASRSITRCSYNHGKANVRVWSPQRYLSTNKPGQEPSASSKVASSSGTVAPKNESPSTLRGIIRNFLGPKGKWTSLLPAKNIQRLHDLIRQDLRPFMLTSFVLSFL